MNAYNRRYFTALLPCRCCGMEPVRVYCDATDLYAVKCDCGNRTAGFTTIAGASKSWNAMNKKGAAPGVQDRGRHGEKKQGYCIAGKGQKSSVHVRGLRL